IRIFLRDALDTEPALVALAAVGGHDTRVLQFGFEFPLVVWNSSDTCNVSGTEKFAREIDQWDFTLAEHCRGNVDVDAQVTGLHDANTLVVSSPDLETAAQGTTELVGVKVGTDRDERQS